jgi:hypothetical protein
MQQEGIPQIDEIDLDADQRRFEADEICETLKCVVLDEFTRVEGEFIRRIADSEFISESQLDWLRKIRDRKRIL